MKKKRTRLRPVASRHKIINIGKTSRICKTSKIGNKNKISNINTKNKTKIENIKNKINALFQNQNRQIRPNQKLKQGVLYCINNLREMRGE